VTFSFKRFACVPPEGVMRRSRTSPQQRSELAGSHAFIATAFVASRTRILEDKSARTASQHIFVPVVSNLRNELGISPLSEKVIEYINKWKAHMQRMEHTCIPLQAYKYQPSVKRDIVRPRRRWIKTQLY
jgi:hypothetical protein